MGRTDIRQGGCDALMEFTRNIEDADAVLTPYGILLAVLDDEDLAEQCLTALCNYAKSYPMGNNQAAAIVFFDEYEAVFGTVDLWDGSEEVM